MQLNLARDVYPRLADARDARALVEHPRNACLHMEGGRFHFLDRAHGDRLVALKGLTSLLQAFYWPTYSPWAKTESADVRAVKRSVAALRHARKSAPAPKKTLAKPPAKRGTWRTALEAARGSVRGSIVHRQLGEWITHDRAAFNTLNPSGQHPLLRQALLALAAADLLPLAVEFRVAWTDGRLGTAIDLVTVHRETGVVRFVEVKTCQSRRLFFLDEPACPFAGKLRELARAAGAGPDSARPLPRSACTRAAVQLAVSVCMAVEGTGFGDRPYEAAVLLLNEVEASAEWHRVRPSFFRTYGWPLYADLKARLPAWRAQQRAGKDAVSVAEDDF